MNSSAFANSLCFMLLAANLYALDTFYDPEKWDQYQERVLRLREHEKLAFVRPAPGTHPIVAVQTLILPDFKVKDMTVYEAFNALANRCGERGVNLTFYVNSSADRGGAHMTYESSAGDTVGKILRYLMTISKTHIHLSGNNILVWSYDDTLNPFVVTYDVRVLSEKAAGYCGLPRPPVSGKTDAWVAVERALMDQGIPFPPGTYADYRPDIHSLVIINAGVTLGSLNRWFEEMENRVVIESAKGQGIVPMHDYQLETRSYSISEQATQKIHGWLMDKKNKLLPFARHTKDIVSFSRTAVSEMPDGSAAWLDVKSRRLWVRNKPDNLDDFEKDRDGWLAQLENHPAYMIMPSKK